MPRKKPAPPRSLFILSLPRSLSTSVYHVACGALGLQAPVWTSDGEILNHERSALHAGSGGAAMFTREEETGRFARILAFLQEVTQVNGFAYKDVVQPFVASSWLATQDFPVLKIRRRVEDIAYAMIARKWFYPADAFPESSLTGSMLLGLSRAWAAIERVPGETLDFEDLITQDEVLLDTLHSLYPQVELRPQSLRGPAFEQKKREILDRRQTPLYQDLVRQARALESSTASF